MFILQPMTYLATDRPVAVKAWEGSLIPTSSPVLDNVTLLNPPVVFGSFCSGDGKMKCNVLCQAGLVSQQTKPSVYHTIWIPTFTCSHEIWAREYKWLKLAPSVGLQGSTLDMGLFSTSHAPFCRTRSVHNYSQQNLHIIQVAWFVLYFCILLFSMST